VSDAMGMTGRGDYTFLRVLVAKIGVRCGRSLRINGTVEGRSGRPETSLLYEVDLVGAIVDVDRSKFAEDVFAKQAIKIGAENAAEAVEIHDGDAAGEPGVAFQLEIDWQRDALADEAGLLARALREAEPIPDVAVSFRADNRARRARVEQKCYRLTVDLAFHEDHRLNGAKRKVDDVGMRDISKRQRQQ
jgi:hypothetical protein